MFQVQMMIPNVVINGSTALFFYSFFTLMHCVLWVRSQLFGSMRNSVEQGWDAQPTWTYDYVRKWPWLHVQCCHIKHTRCSVQTGDKVCDPSWETLAGVGPGAALCGGWRRRQGGQAP